MPYNPSEAHIKELLEEFGQLYQQYLDESDAYEGASLWSNKRCQEINTELQTLCRQQVLSEVATVTKKEVFPQQSDKELEETLNGFTKLGCWYEGYSYCRLEIIKKLASLTTSKETK